MGLEYLVTSSILIGPFLISEEKMRIFSSDTERFVGSVLAFDHSNIDSAVLIAVAAIISAMSSSQVFVVVYKCHLKNPDK